MSSDNITMDVDSDSITMNADEYGHPPLSEIETLIAKILQTPLGSHDATHELQDREGSKEYDDSLKKELLGIWRMNQDDRVCAELIREQDDSYELLQDKISNCAKCRPFIYGVPKEADAVIFCLAPKGQDVKRRKHLMFETTFEELIPQCTWNAQWFKACMEDISYSDWCKAAIAAARTERNAEFLESMMQNVHPGIWKNTEFKSTLLIEIVTTACWHSHSLVTSSINRSLARETPATEETTTDKLEEFEKIAIRKVLALRDIRIESSILQDLQRQTANAGLYEVKGVLKNL
jgi:hypothetical protein